MNVINWKRLIFFNIFYLFFMYFFDKVGQVVCFVLGVDLFGKVFFFVDGFFVVFVNLFLSFVFMDLLIGFFGVVFIWLIVYVKGKNVKKYCKGVEYGFVCWGNVEDICFYIDLVF